MAIHFHQLPHTKAEREDRQFSQDVSVYKGGFVLTRDRSRAKSGRAIDEGCCNWNDMIVPGRRKRRRRRMRRMCTL